MRRLILIIIIIIPLFSLKGQDNLLDKPLALAHVKMSMDAIYGFDFEEGRKQIEMVKSYITNHPAVYFLDAFYIYWKFFPLTPEKEEAAEFTSLMEKCIEESKSRVERNSDDLEATFFDLFGRAFYVMFWADNGKPGKVFPHLNTLYRHTMEGFELMYLFNEFYFTTGLYNYYIEAYPQKHPSYKSIVSLFQDGDMEKGLEQLKYCANNTIFLRIEAKLFLSLLYLNYENDLDNSSTYAAELYNEFPDNPYYAGKYLEILLYNKKFFFAPVILSRLENQDHEFAKMQYHLFNAMYLEKSEKNYTEARKYYELALQESLKYGYFTDHYTAMAYMGLGRYCQRRGNESKARKYFREAEKNTAYEYVLQDR